MCKLRCVCARARVGARARACVRVRARVRACVRACACARACVRRVRACANHDNLLGQATECLGNRANIFARREGREGERGSQRDRTDRRGD